MNYWIRIFSILAASLWSAVVPANAQVNVTQEHNNLSRDGLFNDAAFTPSAAANQGHRAPVANGVPRPDHVIVVIEENHSYSEIIGSTSAPYINNALANQGAVMTASFALTHPSQPNYLDLFSGSNQGVTDDTTPPPGSPYDAANLGSELLDSNLTFGGYSEDMPSVGYTGSAYGYYTRRHNPWVDFSNVPTEDNMPYAGYFPSDLTQLPT